MGDYSHQDHGEMEWYEMEGFRNGPDAGWRCVECHVIAEPDRADNVFDSHDCKRYQELREGMMGAL